MLFSYCTNIHPGETWEEIFEALRLRVPAVRARLPRARTDPFPLGLRLGARAAADLSADRAALRRLRSWMEDENLLAYTINGFPYGTFHGTRVKENVFAPDWSEPARSAYTLQLFELLCEMLPEGSEGSVSTVPGSFKEFTAAEPARLPAIIRALRELALALEELSTANNLDLHLGLEPEPLGLLENTTDTLAFFDRLSDGLGGADRAILFRRIGVCYDACHFAIAYEEAPAALDAFRAAGIRLSKIHLSNALALDPRDPEAIRRLRAFDEPTYLHQVAARDADNRITCHRDLPDALATLGSTAGPEAVEWRVHFHIPLYAEPEAPLGGTISHLGGLATWLHHHPAACRHFEMETYTFGVLPDKLRQTTVESMLAEEYRWCQTRFFPLLRGDSA